LNEVEEILEMIQAAEFDEVMRPLFEQVARCIGSPHFQVAERALFLWNNEYIVSLIAQKRDALLPIVFEALYTNSRSHWNSTVHGLTCNVVKLFMEMDPKLFDDCSATNAAEQEERVKKDAAKAAEWKAIEEAAEKNPLYSQVKNALNAKASLAYAMRAQQLKDGGDLFDLSSVVESDSAGFGSVTEVDKSVRRKSALPV